MKRLAIAGLAAMLAAAPASAQKYETISREKAFGVNVAIGSLIGGAGAAIHHKPVLEGMLKGAAGGALIGGAKYAIGENLDLAYPARIAASIGDNIIRNTAEGDPAFSYLSTRLGPIHIEMDEGDFAVRIIPEAAAAIAGRVAAGQDIDWESTLRYGAPIFRTPADTTSGRRMGDALFGTIRVEREPAPWEGTSLDCDETMLEARPEGNGTFKRYIMNCEESDVVLREPKTRTTAHELIHDIQYTASTSLNVLIPEKIEEKLEALERRLNVKLDYVLPTIVPAATLLLPKNIIPNEIEAASFTNHLPDKTRSGKFLCSYSYEVNEHKQGSVTYSSGKLIFNNCR